MAINLDKALFFANQSFGSRQELLTFMADQLHDQGYVTESYKENLIQRESDYPTGLNSEAPRVAIPHTDYNLVKRSTLCIATLTDDVMFNNMENPEEEIPIRIVIMMALDNPNGQIEMLQKIIGIVQENDLKEDLLTASTNEELYEKMSKIFN